MFFTIWFKDGAGRQEGLTESQMREQSKRFGFDADEVLTKGEAFMWADGVEPYADPSWFSDDIVGGCDLEDLLQTIVRGAWFVRD